MSMSKKSKTTAYVAAPELPEPLADKYIAILSALSGIVPVSEAARTIGLSRVRFQTLMHRGQAALIEAIEPKPAGRPGLSQTERGLREENARLREENRRLTDQAERNDRLFNVASQLLRGTAGRARSSRSSPKKSPAPEEDRSPEALLRRSLELRSIGMNAALAAGVLGVPSSTLRRWRRRPGAAGRDRLIRSRAPRLGALRTVARMVEATGGQVGAAALSRRVTGISRRQAAAVKERVQTRMERKRKASAKRVRITQPGIVRGFDAMYVGERRLLAASDASIPYRTQILISDRYDEESVLEVLRRDIAEHGPPLVYRLDRAACQRTPRIRAELASQGVQLLHGPPYHSQYYGQTERQNREHRGWLRAHESLVESDPGRAALLMRSGLNDAWPRGTLGFRTSSELWAMRPKLKEDRAAWMREIAERATALELEGMNEDQAQRFAIEAALTKRGYLRVEAGRGAK